MVATFKPHNRISVEGAFPAAQGVTGEIWSFSLASDDGHTPQDLGPLVQGPIETWFHDPNNMILSTITMTGIRVEAVSADGKVATSFLVNSSVAGGLVQTNSMPWICCMAITLDTADTNPKGTKIRGRFYPPATGWDGRSLGIGTNLGLNVAQSGARLVTALNAAGANIVVASQTGGGKNAVVTGCSADNVIDTQRRRKNHAVGVRGAQALPFP